MSARLSSIAGMVPEGGRLCDVGCDHAHVPVWLLKNGIIPSALAMDVIPGPLQKAKENLEMYGEVSRVELRQSDGLKDYHIGEAQTLLISGMGGMLIRTILLHEREKAQSFQTIILQPQSDPWLVRSALRELGFSIDREDLIYDGGKYYPVMRAVNAAERLRPNWGTLPEEYLGTSEEDLTEAEDIFGPVLLREQNEVLLQFILWRLQVMNRIMQSVSVSRQNAGEKEDPRILNKIEEVSRNVFLLKLSLQMFEKQQ